MFQFVQIPFGTGVQNKGEEINTEVQEELKLLESGQTLEPEEIDLEISSLPMVIGADGVFVPFRPETNSPEGKTDGMK